MEHVDDGRFWDSAILPLLRYRETLQRSHSALQQMVVSTAGTQWRRSWADIMQQPELDEQTHKLF